jgi:hypothetical protein
MKQLANAGWRQPKVQLDIQQLFSTKRQQVHALQEGLPFSEVILVILQLILVYSRLLICHLLQAWLCTYLACCLATGCQICRLHHLELQGHKYSQQTYKTYAEAFSVAWQQLHPELAIVAGEDGPGAAVRLLEDQYW